MKGLDASSALYILSVSSQIAGALILLLWACGNTRKRIIDKYYPEAVDAIRDDNENIVMEKEKIRKCAVEIYMNRFSFFSIAVGYFLAVFGDLTVKKSIAVIGIGVSTVILIFFGYHISKIMARLLYRKDIMININEVSHDVITPMTDKEVDEICK